MSCLLWARKILRRARFASEKSRPHHPVQRLLPRAEAAEGPHPLASAGRARCSRGCSQRMGREPRKSAEQVTGQPSKWSPGAWSGPKMLNSVHIKRGCEAMTSAYASPKMGKGEGREISQQAQRILQNEYHKIEYCMHNIAYFVQADNRMYHIIVQIVCNTFMSMNAYNITCTHWRNELVFGALNIFWGGVSRKQSRLWPMTQIPRSMAVAFF